MVGALFGGAALCASGCIAESDRMRPIAAPSPDPPASGAASVVFFREARTARETVVTLLDDAGRFLADVPAVSCVRVEVLPGHRSFVAFADSHAMLSGELEAGRIYFVELEVKIGALSPRVRLMPIGKGHPRRPELSQIFEACRWLVADESVVTPPDLARVTDARYDEARRSEGPEPIPAIAPSDGFREAAGALSLPSPP